MRCSNRVLLTLLGLTVALEAAPRECYADSRVPVYIDTDSANEVDDIFAILRLLRAEEVDVRGLSSIGWSGSSAPGLLQRRPDFGAATYRSQAVNEDILSLVRKSDEVSHPMGAMWPIAPPSRPVDSAAARDIIAKSLEMPHGIRLRVYVLGAFTNVASALMFDPTLKDRIEVYVIGYNFKEGALDHDVFNNLGDRLASEYLLESGATLYIMPANLVAGFKFDRDEFAEKADDPLERWLLHRWQDFEGIASSWGPGLKDYDFRRWVMWDLALIEASLRPSFSRIADLDGFKSRVKLFRDPDLDSMKRDFYSAIDHPDANGGVRESKIGCSAQSSNSLTAGEVAAGWKLLFDGKTLKGWHTFKGREVDRRWSVHNEELVLSPSATRRASGADLETDGTFQNFELSIEWKISPQGNSGIFYRSSSEGVNHPWEGGPEYQILDNENEGGPPIRQAGSVWDFYAPIRDVTKPVGEFNQTRIIVRGERVEHWMNGVKLLSYQLGSKDFRIRHAASAFRDWPKYGSATQGTIVLQDEGRAVSFRNIKIRQID